MSLKKLGWNYIQYTGLNNSDSGANLVADANGALSTNLGQYTPAFTWGGTSSAYVLGGFWSPTSPIASDVQKFSLTSDSASTDIGQMAIDRVEKAGTLKNIGVASYTVGGSPLRDDIQKMPFSSETVTAIGILSYPSPSTSPSAYGGYSASSPTDGYYVAGYRNPQSPSTYGHTADKIPFASDTDGVSIRPTVPQISRYGGMSWSQQDKAYWALGGNPFATNGAHGLDHYEFTYSSETYVTIPALAPTVVPVHNSGVSFASTSQSDTYAYMMGGNNSDQLWPSPGAYLYGGTALAYSKDQVTKFPFASLNSWADVGELIASSREHSGHSSTTNGYAAGGYASGPNPYQQLSIMNKFPFSSDVPASNIGNLLRATTSGSGTEV